MNILLTVVVLTALWLLFRYQFRLLRRLLQAQRESIGLQAELLRGNLLAGPRYADPRRLNHFEQRVSSQNGEDGVIAEIFRRIGVTNRFFVEFGCGSGQENNTLLLLEQGWSGLWMDGSAKAIAGAERRCAAARGEGRLTTRQAMITAENLTELFRDAHVPPEPDLVSIDIDRNDYWVWKALRPYRPRVVVIEYNPLFPPGVSWVIPYDAQAPWDGSARTGASLKALEELGREKGYSLVGCVLAGVNAFFVRDDLVGDRFAAPFTAEHHYEPARYALHSGDANHPRRG